jgi:hypothetical protein
MTQPREERIARNEVLFREINERLKEMQETFNVLDQRSEFVCECGNVECTERIEMSPPEYKRLRSDPTTFAVVNGHEAEDVEDVVQIATGHLIVRKRVGEAARIVRLEDPRG